MTTIPDAFTATPAREALARRCGCPDPAAAFAAFRDYHVAAGTVSSDWEATWRAACERIRGQQIGADQLAFGLELRRV